MIQSQTLRYIDFNDSYVHFFPGMTILIESSWEKHPLSGGRGRVWLQVYDFNPGSLQSETRLI